MQKESGLSHVETHPFPVQKQHLTFNTSQHTYRSHSRCCKIDFINTPPQITNKTFEKRSLTLPPPPPMMPFLQSSARYVTNIRKPYIDSSVVQGGCTHTAALYHCRTRSLTHSTHPSARHGVRSPATTTFANQRPPSTLDRATAQLHLLYLMAGVCVCAVFMVKTEENQGKSFKKFWRLQRWVKQEAQPQQLLTKIVQ